MIDWRGASRKGGRSKIGLTVHKLLKNGVEKMSVFASEQKFMKKSNLESL
jgi:hypothetical protein